MTPQPLSWKADATIRTHVVNALAAWNAVMPNQQWIETPTSSYPNVEFKDEQCMESFIFVPGCTVFTGWAVLYPQNANWAWNIQVYIKFGVDGNYDNNTKQAVIAHEIGHIFGLHERYSNGCNNSEVSIMDGLYKPFMSNNVYHCDNITGPATLDSNRTSQFYTTGEFDNFTAYTHNGLIQFEWLDKSWADNRHVLHYHYHNGSEWVYLGLWSHATDVGLHKDIELRSIVEVLNPNNYGAPHGRWYLGCGYPLFTHNNGS